MQLTIVRVGSFADLLNPSYLDTAEETSVQTMKKAPKKKAKGRPEERLHQPPISRADKRAISAYLKQLQTVTQRRLDKLDRLETAAPAEWVEKQRPFLRNALAFLRECVVNHNRRRVKEDA